MFNMFCYQPMLESSIFCVIIKENPCFFRQCYADTWIDTSDKQIIDITMVDLFMTAQPYTEKMTHWSSTI